VQQVANQFLYRRGNTLYFRRAVPPAARTAFGGRREVSVSLKTNNLAEARHRLAQHLRAFDQTLALATRRPDPTTAANDDRPVTPAMIDMAVRDWFEERLGREAERDFNRGSPDLGATSDDRARYEKLLVESHRRGQPQLDTHWTATSIAERRGWQLDEEHKLYAYLLNRVARGELEIGRRITDEIDILPLVERDAFFSPQAYLLDEKRRQEDTPRTSVTITGLLDAYVAEAQCKPATVKAWRACLNNLVAFLGHDDAGRVTPQDVVRWKENLGTPDTKGICRSSRTIRDKYLAAAKTVFKWAAENHKLASNPATGISMRVRKRVRLRDPGLNDDEACRILTAALAYDVAGPAPLQSRARRWIPWLCAYTGARVGEIAQLRGEDVLKREGHSCLLITPEAGSQKTDQARTVPLHPHLVEQGFATAMKGLKGPLFFDADNYRGGSDGNPQSKKVAERLAKWVRSLGVDDPNVLPNHGWRHRFKTEARRAGMEASIADAIQGHAHRTEGEGYGEVPAGAMKRELEKMRRFRIEVVNGSSRTILPSVEADG